MRGWRWTKRSGLVALCYYALAMTTLLLEYLSERNKLSHGRYTDTFNPFVFSETLTWPTSRFVADWHGYPDRFSEPLWRKTLNDCLPSHLWSVVVQGALVFVIVEICGVIIQRRGRGRAARGPVPSG